tara:strand:- start:172 stop:426 length:255 start_codon:yes stop_codon:yes gene_type:complete
LKNKFFKNMKYLLAAILLTTGCTQIKYKHQDHVDYRYYVMDVNGTEPDASFEDRKDAQKYVDKFKEFHEYRIVKAQSYTNTNDQ